MKRSDKTDVNKVPCLWMTCEKYIDLGQPKNVAPGPGCSEFD